ncbi:MAG: hypothetical protein ACR2KV_17585 [Solirubrobacteraceae bacterium]
MRFVPAAIAAIVGLLGCGPAASIPRGEFINRGDAICRATATRIDQLAAPAPATRARPEVRAGYVDAYVAELRHELVMLRAIGYPRGGRRRLNRAYEAVDAALTAVERDPLSFRESSFAPSAAELRAAGLTDCRP